MSKNTTSALTHQLVETIQDLVNPVNLFSGAKLEDVLVADNIVIFKRTSSEMLRPQGTTHNYHHRFELVIPLVKEGRIHVDGHSYMLGGGRTYLIFPHQFHHYLDIENGELNWLFITFECKRSEELAPLRNSPRVFDTESMSMIAETLKNYLSIAPGAERSFGLVFSISKLLRRLLSAREANCAVTEENTPDDATHGDMLRSINAYVRDNLDKTLTIADLSKHTGYSISYLRAIFRKQFGVSLGSYMRESRISTAASMLSSPDHGSIENIAKICGFASIFAFSRAFKTAIGVPPTAYQKFLQTGKMTGTKTFVLRRKRGKSTAGNFL